MGDGDGDGEEDEREAWTLRIHSAVLRALDAQPLWEQEAALLAQRACEAASGRGGAPPAPQQHQPELARGVTDALAALMRSDKERLQAGVFRPSHALPTMSVEQFGEAELARMQVAGRKQAARDASQAAARVDMGSEEEEEERLAKARAWDDWKVCACVAYCNFHQSSSDTRLPAPHK